MSFKSHTTYPLADAARYDDELGKGFSFVAVADEIPEGLEITMVDCWVVNEAGEQHPGYDESPVPVRFCDVLGDQGRPSDSTPARKPFMGWA